MLLINSKEIKMDLAKLGVSPNKSLTVQFPNVPKEHLPSFIRGVIDGDGYVNPDGYRVNITTASYHFAQGLLSLFKDWDLQTKLYTSTTKTGNPLYRVWINGKNHVMRLASIIYDCDKSNKLCVLSKKVHMTGLTRSNNSNNKLRHVTKQGRIPFRTNISASLIEKLREISEQRKIPINHLVEIGLRNMLKDKIISYDKNSRPTDRIQFKTTYNKELLDAIREFAVQNQLNVNDIIEHSSKYIEVEE